MGLSIGAAALDNAMLGNQQISAIMLGAQEVWSSFKLPEFTGNCAIYGNKESGRIEIYESGILTLSKGIYDFFLVGGGGRGGFYRSGGGGGGYTTTEIGVTVQGSDNIEVVIGASNSKTTISEPNIGINLSANQGKAGENRETTGGNGDGGNGGSGGGSYGRGGVGGSDGSDGVDGSLKGNSPGTGQGSTTRSFGDPNGVLYAGGGGACYSTSGETNAGGDGGGGTGGPYTEANSSTAGTPNTGGGGGGGTTAAGALGGSGIAIIRWNNAA